MNFDVHHPYPAPWQSPASGAEPEHAVSVEVAYDEVQPVDLSGEPEGVGTSLPLARQHGPGGGRGDGWTLYRCSTGWALELDVWPSENTLAEIADALHRQRWFCHWLTVALPTLIPSSQYQAVLFEAIEGAVQCPCGYFHDTKLVRRVGGYRDLAKVRRVVPYLATHTY